MNINEIIKESPITIKAFPEYNDSQIQNAIDLFSDAIVLDIVEVDYELLKKDENYALRRISDNKILAIAKTKIVNYFNKNYLKIIMIVVIKEFRLLGIGRIFLFGIKETSNIPLICDDAFSNAGFELFKSLLNKNSLFQMKSIDKTDGSIDKFKPGDENNYELAIIIENKTIGLFREGFYIGSPNDRMYLKFLD